MKAIAFDTLEFAKRLRAAEFTEKQAETLASAVSEIIDSRLATKEDIALLQRYIDEIFSGSQRSIDDKISGLQRDIDDKVCTLQRNLHDKTAGLQRDMQELELRLKHDLTLRLGTMLAATVAIVAALVRLL